ncbi:MAG: SMI1/KNR4 family protein [Alphaproteobacteria bacterium]
MIEMEKENGNIDENILRAIEQFWGFQLPKSYREFIIRKNGGVPLRKIFDFKDKTDGSCLVDFFGFVKDFCTNLLLKRVYAGDRVPENTLPIAADVYGNLILLSVKGPDRGKIYFWDHEMEADTDHGETPDYSNLTLVADSFDEFIQNLKSEDDLDA